MRNTITSYLQVGCTESPLPKLFSRYVNNFEKHLARVTRFCTRMSLYANYPVNTSVCFKIRQSNGQTVLTQPVVADGRMQDVWNLPDPWLHLERTAFGGVARDHYFLPLTSLFSLCLLHPNPVSVKKIKE